MMIPVDSSPTCAGPARTMHGSVNAMTTTSVSAPVPATPPARNAAPPAAQAPPPEDRASEIVDRLVASEAFNNNLVGKLGRGNEVTIEIGDREVIRIKSEGPGLLERFAVGTRAAVGALASEASGLVKADPAFAFKETALGVKSQVYSGLPSEIQKAADIGFLPMLRVVTLAMDFKKFMDTRKNPDATKMDKVVDGGHLVTDVAGIAGAVAMSVPAMGPVAMPLTIVGLTGDVAAFTYHIMDYVKQRGEEYLASKRAKEAQQQPPAPQPAPTPAPAAPTTILAA